MSQSDGEQLGPGPEVAASPRRFGYHPSLDGIRGILMLWIMGFHYGVRLFGSAQYGLDVFFVLSGFLITTLLLQEQEGTGLISLKLFYLRRAARLLPALFLACAIVAGASLLDEIVEGEPILHPASIHTAFVAVALTLFYAASWAQALTGVTGAGSPLTHTWSLSVEEWFYALWPLLLIFALRRPRSLSRLVVGLAAIAMVYRLISEQVISSRAYLYFALDQRACQLLAGCALGALIFQYGNRIFRHQRLLTVTGLAGAAAVAVFVGRPGDSGHALWTPLEPGAAVGVSLASVAGLALVVARPESLLARSLSLRPLVWVGRRSYGLYLYHLPLIALISPWAADGRVPWRTALISIPLIFLLAAVSYRWIEQPSIRYMRRREKRIRAEREAVAPQAAAAAVALPG